MNTYEPGEKVKVNWNGDWVNAKIIKAENFNKQHGLPEFYEVNIAEAGLIRINLTASFSVHSIKKADGITRAVRRNEAKKTRG